MVAPCTAPTGPLAPDVFIPHWPAGHLAGQSLSGLAGPADGDGYLHGVFVGYWAMIEHAVRDVGACLVGSLYCAEHVCMDPLFKGL